MLALDSAELLADLPTHLVQCAPASRGIEASIFVPALTNDLILSCPFSAAVVRSHGIARRQCPALTDPSSRGLLVAEGRRTTGSRQATQTFRWLNSAIPRIMA